MGMSQGLQGAERLPPLKGRLDRENIDGDHDLPRPHLFGPVTQHLLVSQVLWIKATL
jgi:hypothetical protein